MIFHIIVGADSLWRWYLTDPQNRRIAESGEGYTSEKDCRESIRLTESTTTATPIVLTP